MQLVSTVTVGAGGAASIEFTSIPQTGTDLLLVVSLRQASGTNPSGTVLFRPNGTNATTAWRSLSGDGSSTTSTSSTDNRFTLWQVSAGATANTFSNAQVYFPNYAGTNVKSYSIDAVTENNAAAARQDIRAVTMTDYTTAITSIVLTSDFVQHSTASLYIITKA